jgi:hypothetical protein
MMPLPFACPNAGFKPFDRPECRQNQFFRSQAFSPCRTGQDVGELDVRDLDVGDLEGGCPVSVVVDGARAPFDPANHLLDHLLGQIEAAA